MTEYRYDNSEEEIKSAAHPMIFLAGPTVRSYQTHLVSWRGECIEEFKKQGFDGSLIIPEFSNTFRLKKLDIIHWEYNGLCCADCIMFWIPRTKELIGLTTNFELGYYLRKSPDKIVYGRPDNAYKIDYLDAMWTIDFMQKNQIPRQICKTMEETVKMAIQTAKGLHGVVE